ncbi:type III secretion protein [Mesorhizobium tianshanense]|nr:type III secretion system cytoplasmic ring protein SctQ [Mesorhizobium tianshanense]GLS34710.1 type III secretion protein [Mesorhizobium tianshanense]
MARAEPLELTQVAAIYLDALNAFYRRRPPVEVVVGAESVTIKAVWPRVAGQEPRSSIGFEIAGSKASLEMPRALLDKWLVQADPAVDLERIALEHAALLVESFLASELSWLEAKLGEAITLDAVNGKSMTASPPFAFIVNSGEGAFSCALRFDDAGHAAALAGLLNAASGEGAPLPDDVPVQVGLWRGAVEVSVGELQSLRPGDVVLLDGIGATALLVIAERLVAPVELIDAGPRLMASPCQFNGSRWEWIMNQKTAPDAVQTLDDAALDDLPVSLVFELGRTVLPIGEVRQLGAGTIVPLPGLESETVDVIANGKRVGRGEIVRIGESLGVRLFGMFGNA